MFPSPSPSPIAQTSCDTFLACFNSCTLPKRKGQPATSLPGPWLHFLFNICSIDDLKPRERRFPSSLLSLLCLLSSSVLSGGLCCPDCERNPTSTPWTEEEEQQQQQHQVVTTITTFPAILLCFEAFTTRVGQPFIGTTLGQSHPSHRPAICRRMLHLSPPRGPYQIQTTDPAAAMASSHLPKDAFSHARGFCYHKMRPRAFGGKPRA